MTSDNSRLWQKMLLMRCRVKGKIERRKGSVGKEKGDKWKGKWAKRSRKRK